jgi:hypothetical protein
MSSELEDALAQLLFSASSIIDAHGDFEPAVVSVRALNSIRRVGLIALADAGGKPKRKRVRPAAVLQLAA